MKKFVLALAALAFGFSAFAESSVSFFNKVYEDDAFYFKSDDDSSTDFPALKDKMNVEYQSEHVDAAITAVIAIDDWNDKHFGIDGYIDDWYVEWRLFQPFTLAFHDNIFSKGSYLPVYDDNMEGGNIGSDGLTGVWRPQVFKNALRLAATLPFNFTKNGYDGSDVNWLKGKRYDDNGDEIDDNQYVNLGLGAIYTAASFQVGATVKDILDNDERLIGVSVAFPDFFGKVKGLQLAGGFTNSKAKNAGFDDLLLAGGVIGENVLNVALTYESDAATVAVESVTNLKEDNFESPYDIYVGASCGFGLSEQATLTVTGKILSDLSKEEDQGYEAENAYNIGAALDFQVNKNNSFGAEFNITLVDSDYAIAVPVYWKWEM